MTRNMATLSILGTRIPYSLSHVLESQNWDFKCQHIFHSLNDSRELIVLNLFPFGLDGFSPRIKQFEAAIVITVVSVLLLSPTVSKVQVDNDIDKLIM